MSTSSRSEQVPSRRAGNALPWNPDHPAVFVEPAPDAPHISLVRHDGYPYQEDWDERGTGWAGLFHIASRYLRLVDKRLKLPQAWLDDLREEPSSRARPPVSLHWLRGRGDPRHSYWVERQSGLDDASRPATGPVLDRAAVLLAGLWFRAASFPPFPLYGGQGLRVMVQAGPRQEGPAPVRITGVSSTLPLPQMDRIVEMFERLPERMFESLPERIAAVFALPEEVKVVDLGVWVPGAQQEQEQFLILFAKTAPAPDYEGHSRSEYSYDRTSYLLVMRANPDWREGLEPLARRPLIAFADADVFVQDPVSQNGALDFTRLRPSRSCTKLDGERVNVQLGNLPPGASGMVQLVDPDPNTPPHPDFRVTNSRLVDPPLAENVPKEVPPSVHDHVRTNTFAAVNAFYHTSELFSRMRTYGLPPASYFRFVTRPIDVRYRAGIFPGAGDGRTVNAQVRWTLRPGPSPTGTIEIRFALGDLQSAVGRLPANLPSAVERSPLGVASDPRWCWHEYCHVLLTAAMGDLELRFAHSAGDAMAAILCDPDSELASDLSGASTNNGPWRGVTFPWVLIPRRHDRDVHDGWGWTGPMNHREVYFAVPGLSDKRGYWTEQILSSALFRLYRAIGGDSEVLSQGQRVSARPERKNAADYAAYLIMRTIWSLGAAAVTPSTTPHDFVDAMRKADTATASAPGPGGYVGGTVHKVVQWAFERQGLYGMPVAGSPVIGPEETATVDLHIEDLRPKPDGPYSPVDLLGQAWHAHPDALWVKNPWWGKKRKVRVKVQNRGVAQASNTRVDVWCTPVGGGPIPPYPGATWQWLGSETRHVPGRTNQIPGAKKFGPFAWTPPAGPQEYAILAAATCDADRSNIDPATGHPCVTVASPIHLLVGCDNNLGLIRVMIT